MKHAPLSSLKLILAALAVAAAAPASSQTSAVGPYFATPSWDQTLPAASRFIVLSNMSLEAVLDRETGLVWERTPDATEYSLVESLGVSGFTACAERGTGGRGGWRVPTLAEITSLMEPGAPRAFRLPVGHPFQNVLSASTYTWFATATSYSKGPGLLYVLAASALSNYEFQVALTPNVNGTYRVWCVRTPSGYPF